MSAPRLARALAVASAVLMVAGVVPVRAIDAPSGGIDASRDATTAPRAQHDYLLSCGGCHGLDGAGSARVPSLHEIARLLARAGGRDYVLRVPGVASAPLSDARLAALLDWVAGRFGGATVAPGFTAAEVGKARAEPFADPRAARAALP